MHTLKKVLKEEFHLKQLRKRIVDLKTKGKEFEEAEEARHLYNVNLINRNPLKEPVPFVRIDRGGRYTQKAQNLNKTEIPNFSAVSALSQYDECHSNNDRNPFELSFNKFMSSRKNTSENIRKDIEHRVKFSNIDLEIHMGRKGSSNRESNNYIDSDRVSVERVPHKAYNELYNLKDANDPNSTYLSEL